MTCSVTTRGLLPEEEEKLYLGKRITKEIVNRLRKAGIKELIMKKATLINRVFAHDVVDPETGESLITIFAEGPTSRQLLAPGDTPGSTVLRVESQYIFNWDTRSFRPGIYVLRLTPSDGATRSVTLEIR